MSGIIAFPGHWDAGNSVLLWDIFRPKVLWLCLSYVPIALIKHHGKNNLGRKGLIVSYSLHPLSRAVGAGVDADTWRNTAYRLASPGFLSWFFIPPRSTYKEAAHLQWAGAYNNYHPTGLPTGQSCGGIFSTELFSLQTPLACVKLTKELANTDLLANPPPCVFLGICSNIIKPVRV